MGGREGVRKGRGGDSEGRREEKGQREGSMLVGGGREEGRERHMKGCLRKV